jgi:predicted RNA binding protein YcfA (HicA-like mRNA interferase family)
MGPEDFGATWFSLIRISGSHHILTDGNRRVTVPVHGAEDLKPVRIVDFTA